MNYLQRQSDMKFAPEEALLADYFGEGNYVPFHAKQVQQRKLPLGKKRFPRRWSTGYSTCSETVGYRV